MQSNSEKLHKRFGWMAQDWVPNVHLSVRKSDELTVDALCGEVLALFDAFNRGEAQPLDFKDSQQ